MKLSVIKNIITSFILPFAILYLGFRLFGNLGGALVMVGFIGYVVFRQRHVFLSNKARKLFAEGNVEEADIVMKKASTAAPKNAMIHSIYGFMLLKMGKVDEAEKNLELAKNLAKTDDEKNSINSSVALLLWKKGLLDEAIHEMEVLTENYKTSATYSTLGFLYIEKGDMEKALEYNQEAYDFNSSNAVILDNYATVLFLRGDYEKAGNVFSELMSKQPGFPDAYFNYASLKEKINQPEDALDLYKKALTKK